MPSKKQKTNGKAASTAPMRFDWRRRIRERRAAAGAPRRTFTAGCCRWCRATPRPATPSRTRHWRGRSSRAGSPARPTSRSSCTSCPPPREQDISDEQVASQIEVLNRDFRATNPDTSTVPPVFAGLVADAQIEFFLATTDPDGEPTSGSPGPRRACSRSGATTASSRRRPAEPTPGPPIGTSTCGCAR